MTYSIIDGLCFDDVLLKPQYSTIRSRSEVDVSVKIGDYTFDQPTIVANMSSCMDKDMAGHIIKSGGLAIMHRFMPPANQIELAEMFGYQLGMSVGVHRSDREMVDKFYTVGTRIFCIDIAHGDSQHCVEMVEFIRKSYSDALIIAGNVATGEGAVRLWEAGADVVKVGIGPSGVCTTRREAGAGVPQLSALMDVADHKSLANCIDRQLYIIADGGIRGGGDLTKSLCFADMAMIGGMFAGCEEAPGDRVIIDGVKYKQYVGSSTHKDKHIEGISALVPSNGASYAVVLEKLLQGLRSGMSYQNARNLVELKDNPMFVKMSGAGITESGTRHIVQGAK